MKGAREDRFGRGLHRGSCSILIGVGRGQSRWSVVSSAELARKPKFSGTPSKMAFAPVQSDARSLMACNAAIRQSPIHRREKRKTPREDLKKRVFAMQYRHIKSLSLQQCTQPCCVWLNHSCTTHHHTPDQQLGNTSGLMSTQSLDRSARPCRRARLSYASKSCVVWRQLEKYWLSTYRSLRSRAASPLFSSPRTCQFTAIQCHPVAKWRARRRLLGPRPGTPGRAGGRLILPALR